MKLNQVFDTCNGRVNGGSEYGWKCYGDARYMDFCDTDGNDDVVNCVYSPSTQQVFEVQVWVNSDNVVYSWRDPEYKKAYKAEAKERNIDPDNAFDDTQYTKVKEEAEILDLAQKMIHGTYVHSKALVEHEYVAANGMKVKIETTALTPESGWPFPTETSGGCGSGCCGGGCGDDVEEDHGWDETICNHRMSDEELNELMSEDAEIDELLRECSTPKTTWDVVLTTKHRLEVKASTMEEAYKKAQEFKEKVKVHNWGDDICWVDHWISKYKIGERVD